MSADTITAEAILSAEAGILAGVLIDNGTVDLLGELRPEHFAAPLHRMVFAESLAQILAGKPADVVSVAVALGERTTAAEVHALTTHLPSPASLRRYAELLGDRHQELALRRVAGEIADLADDSGSPIAQRIESAQSKLATLEAAAVGGAAWLDVGEGMVQHSQVLEDRLDGRIAAFPTGLGAVDEQLDGGLRPGQLVILAARPSMGKSALGLTICSNMAAERPVGFVSLEMSHTDVLDRLTASLSRVPMSSVLRPAAGDGLDWERVTEGIESARRLRLHLLDQPGATLRQVSMLARSLKRRHGLALLVVDYLGLMAGADPRAQRVHQIEEITRGLKTLAKELGIAVLALAQLNRDAEKRADPTPVLSDLRDSGAIEQDADVVMFLHRPIASNPGLGQDWEHYAKVRIAKVRQGRTGDVHLRFDGTHQRFEAWLAPVPRRAAKGRGADL